MPTELEGRRRPATYFAPPYRARGEALRQQVERVAQSPLVDALLRSFGGVAAVLNRERQIVALNSAYLETLGVQRPSGALGLRPGEAIGCVHADDHPAGCGTGQACASCGAAIAMVLAQQRGHAAERECVVRVRRGPGLADLDMTARACPLVVEGEEFLLLTLADVSLEKRRAALERAFFHDVGSLVAGLTAAAVELPAADPEAARAVVADIRLIAARLSREVETQRVLAGDGSGECDTIPEPTGLDEVVERLRALLLRHPAASGKRLAIPGAGLGSLVTDALLLERVLTAMLVNAFEATSRGGEVRLEVVEEPDLVAFRVWNAGAIAASVAPRVFQRYFSTKPGSGRGQGTFTMKLVGERLLGGEVGFTSSATGGTAFTLRLPRRPPAPAGAADAAG